MPPRPVDVMMNGEHQVWSNPEGWDNAKIDKHFKYLREKAPLAPQEGQTISRIKSWGEHATELVVPQSPVGWGVLLGATAATLPLGGWGGLATRAGATAGTSLVNRALLTGGARVAARVGAPVAGGLAGAGVEHLGEEPEIATSYSKAALEGLFIGLAGEGGTALLNTISKVSLGRIVSHSRDPRALSGFMEKLAPELQQTPSGLLPKSARGYAYIFEGDLERAAHQRMSTAATEAVSLSKVQALHLPELRRFLDDLGSARFPSPGPSPSRAIFTPGEALDAYSVLSQAKATDFATMGGRIPKSQMVLEHLRGKVLEDIQTQMGPKATTALRKGMDSYATFNEVKRVLSDDPTKIFPPGGGMNMPELQARVTDRFMANPKARGLMKDSMDDLIHLAWRGAKPPLGAGDIPGALPFMRVSGGGQATVGAHGFGFRLPSRAGGPFQLPGGFMSPAAAAAVQKLAEEYGVPSTVERFTGPAQ